MPVFQFTRKLLLEIQARTDVHSISCRNSLLLFSNNPKTSFSQFRAKTKYLNPHKLHFTFLTPSFCSAKNLYLSHLTLSPIHANPLHELGSPLEIVELKGSGLISFQFVKIKLLFHSKHLEHFSIHTLSWNGTKGYSARASNISLGPSGQGGSLQTDDQPAEVITPDGIIRAYGHTITWLLTVSISSPQSSRSLKPRKKSVSIFLPNFSHFRN